MVGTYGEPSLDGYPPDQNLPFDYHGGPYEFSSGIHYDVDEGNSMRISLRLDTGSDCHDQDKNPLFLPTCSRGRGKQIISNSMMQAYVKMRGPGMGGTDDPLFQWIRFREEIASLNPPPDHKRNISRYVFVYFESLDAIRWKVFLGLGDYGIANSVSLRLLEC